MSISKVIDLEQHSMDKVFGKNEGYWQYRTFDDELLCYTVRYKTKTGKAVKPWICIDGEWKNKGFSNEKFVPFYNANLLKKYPHKPILIVEGEKTADAGNLLYPEFNVITWLGGSDRAKKIDPSFLTGKSVYILPDNDEPGFKAAKKIQQLLQGIVKKLCYVDVSTFGVPEKWDLADLDSDYGEIDSDLVLELIKESKDINNEFKPIDPQTFPVRTKKGRAVNTYENLEHLCIHYNLKPKFNVIRKEILLNMSSKGFTLANKAKLELAEITSLCIKNNVPRTDIIQWLTFIADKNSYNPVEDFIMSKPWDGISRINEFMETIQCVDNNIKRIYMFRWMIGAVAVGLSREGLAHPGVLTFISKQAMGKSSWVRKLVPENLNLTLGEFILNPDDKDSVIRATKYWIVELAEADATVKKSEASAQKAFLTRKMDLYRSPYDRSDTEAPRHTCFVGTVNDSQFLKDETGNRRWWVLEAISINYQHNIDMQQLWAEFKILLDNGEQFHLTESELNILMKENDAYKSMSPIEEAIRLRYRWGQYKYRRMTALQVLEDCGFETKLNRNNLSKEANRVLRQLTEDKPKIIGGIFYFELPPQSTNEMV